MTEPYVAQTLIAPKKHVQGRGLLSSPGTYVAELGTGALAIAAALALAKLCSDTLWSYGASRPGRPRSGTS